MACDCSTCVANYVEVLANKALQLGIRRENEGNMATAESLFNANRGLDAIQSLNGYVGIPGICNTASASTLQTMKSSMAAYGIHMEIDPYRSGSYTIWLTPPQLMDPNLLSKSMLSQDLKGGYLRSARLNYAQSRISRNIASPTQTLSLTDSPDGNAFTLTDGAGRKVSLSYGDMLSDSNIQMKLSSFLPSVNSSQSSSTGVPNMGNTTATNVAMGAGIAAGAIGNKEAASTLIGSIGGGVKSIGSFAKESAVDLAMTAGQEAAMSLFKVLIRSQIVEPILKSGPVMRMLTSGRLGNTRVGRWMARRQLDKRIALLWNDPKYQHLIEPGLMWLIKVGVKKTGLLPESVTTEFETFVDDGLKRHYKRSFGNTIAAFTEGFVGGAFEQRRLRAEEEAKAELGASPEGVNVEVTGHEIDAEVG